MNKPIMICEKSFQIAWARAIRELSNNGWDIWNVVVQIQQPELFDTSNNDLLEDFAKRNGLISQKHVANTIFPQTFFSNGISRPRLYEKYRRFSNRPRKERRHGWGTYFGRMIEYPAPNDSNIDQLGIIIDNIRSRPKNYGSSYAIVIPCPHKDLRRIRGAPCLNYITIQTENTPDPNGKKIINMLAVYRNHNFTERAYGNYLGLCDLMKYITNETYSQIGALTCISSHAYVQKCNVELLQLANTILGIVS
jgi:thymidylate synthase